MNTVKRNRTAWKLAAACALTTAVVLSGCRVGPRYSAPAPPAITAPSYKESTVNFKEAEGWKVASPQDAMIRGNWWEVFNEPELNHLEEQLNVDNQNIKLSFDTFMAARAVVAEARSQYYPTITVGPSFNRSRGSVNVGNSNNTNNTNSGKAANIWSLPD